MLFIPQRIHLYPNKYTRADIQGMSPVICIITPLNMYYIALLHIAYAGNNLCSHEPPWLHVLLTFNVFILLDKVFIGA